MSRRALWASLVVCAIATLAGTPVFAQPPDRSTPPSIEATPPLRLPAIQKRQLSNGLPVWIVELHEVPVVQVNLVALSGSADDPAGKFGLTSLMAAMMVEGAGTHSSLDIDDAIDFLGADLSAAATTDATGVRLHVPVAQLPQALSLMADVALRPTFPSEELERLRQERLVSLLQSRDDPDTIASLAFSRLLFGSTHRFGTMTIGTADTIKGFTTEDLRNRYAEVFRPEISTLIVVGDVSPDAVLPQLESAFGAWKALRPAAPRVPLPTPAQPARREIYLIDKPDAAQSQIRIGWIGVPRSTPDYFPILVMNTILGGAFTSRLNANLREKNGYTYGASSGFDMRVAAGPFTAAAGVQSDKTSEALTEFFNELNGMLKAVPDEELTRAKNYIALRFPAGFETTGDISRRLEDMLVYGLPENYFSEYVANIQRVTVADVQRVAQRYLQTGRFLVVVVGDRKAIEPGIRALNLGPIRSIGLDEVFK